MAYGGEADLVGFLIVLSALFLNRFSGDEFSLQESFKLNGAGGADMGPDQEEECD